MLDITNVDDAAAYLSEHSHYWTMNSWNGLKGYSRNIKIHRLELTPEESKVAWEVITHGSEDWQAVVEELFDEFAARYDYRYQIGINGRSGGYAVLYSGSAVDTPHFSGNFEANNGYGGREYSSKYERWFSLDEAKQAGIYGKSYKKISTSTRSTVVDEADLSDEEVLHFAAILRDFDNTIDELISEFKTFCRSYEAVEETVLVEKTITIFKPKGE